MAAHPRLKLMLAHSGFMGYRKLDGLFAEHPNLYIDTSAAFMLRNGDYLTDAERDRLRPFFLKWADRILFATDATDANAAADNADGMREAHHIRRHVSDFVKPHQNLIVALYLPQDALDKVAHGNFEKLFKAPRTDHWGFSTTALNATVPMPSRR